MENNIIDLFSRIFDNSLSNKEEWYAEIYWQQRWVINIQCLDNNLGGNMYMMMMMMMMMGV